MKERLVENWLIRINERGYQTAFGQILLSRGFRVLRIGHSPYEHGKDVLAISPNGEVHCYQLKDGNIGIAEWDREYGKMCALVETHPVHPALPREFIYRPFLVTNGGFTDPLLDRIAKHNTAWESKGHPKLTTIAGRDLHPQLIRLSADFWPVEPPDIQAFLSLYLANGKVGFVPDEYARFIRTLLTGDLSPLELDRRASAANLFTSYLLGEFYCREDHWSVFRGWVLCAAHIAWAAERRQYTGGQWLDSFALAKAAALESLDALASECAGDSAFLPKRMELDEYTCLRNTVTLGGWAASCLLGNQPSLRDACVSLIERFVSEGRLWFWGESALPSLLAIVWLLEQAGKNEIVRNLLTGFAEEIALRQQTDSTKPMPNPYVGADEALKVGLEQRLNPDVKQRTSVQSYALLPLVLLMVRRGLRTELENLWRELSRVRLTHFVPEHPWGYLEWRCDEGLERDQVFTQPQSWSDLTALAGSPKVERLPGMLRTDWNFSLMFVLAVPHRLAWSLIGTVDRAVRQPSD